MAIPNYVECTFPHAKWFTNATQKQKDKPEFLDALNAYNLFRVAIDNIDNQHLAENLMIQEYVGALNAYKDTVDLLKYKVAFNAQSKFHSNIMEEFWCLLLSEQILRTGLVPRKAGEILFMGDGSALQSTFFGPHSMNALLDEQQSNDPWFQVRCKDRDFLLARKAKILISVDGVEVRQRTKTGSYQPLSERTSLLPLVTIECKQYADKTMLDNAMAAADHRRLTTPSCLDLIVVELNKLSDWNIGGSGLDNLYLLRKQRLTDATFIKGTGPIDTVDVSRRNPIDFVVVTKVYQSVKTHLAAPYWRASEAELLATGVALN